MTIKQLIEKYTADRVRPTAKKKGSIGSERHEVFLTTEEELMKFLLIIENDFHHGNS